MGVRPCSCCTLLMCGGDGGEEEAEVEEEEDSSFYYRWKRKGIPLPPPLFLLQMPQMAAWLLSFDHNMRSPESS